MNNLQNPVLPTFAIAGGKGLASANGVSTECEWTLGLYQLNNFSSSTRRLL